MDFFLFLPGLISSALHQTQTNKKKQTNKYLIFSVNVLYNKHKEYMGNDWMTLT